MLKQFAFPEGHFSCIGFGVVVVSQQMQEAVGEVEFGFCLGAGAPLLGLAASHGQGNGYISQKAYKGGGIFQPGIGLVGGHFSGGEGKHIRRFVLSAELGIEFSHGGIAEPCEGKCTAVQVQASQKSQSPAFSKAHPWQLYGCGAIPNNIHSVIEAFWGGVLSHVERSLGVVSGLLVLKASAGY